jgi:hypothetical protein
LQPWASPINKKILNRRSLRSLAKNPIGEGVETSGYNPGENSTKIVGWIYIVIYEF